MNDGRDFAIGLLIGKAKRIYRMHRMHATVKICRGESKGCDASNIKSCAECYRIDCDDPRRPAEILEAMERGDA